MSKLKKILKLKVKKDFIETLKKELATGKIILDKKTENNKIRKTVYLFIFEKVLEVIEIKEDVEISNLLWDMFYNTVDFCLNFGSELLDSLIEFKNFEEFKIRIQKISDEIDA